jgi:hypothetical protein
MQYTSKEIYQEVSIENDIAFEKVKLVGDVIFNELNSLMKAPPSLIIKIRNIGCFFLKKQKTKRFIQLEERKNEYTDRDLLNILEERMKDYDRYSEKKQIIQKIRRENGEVIKPVIEEEY